MGHIYEVGYTHGVESGIHSEGHTHGVGHLHEVGYIHEVKSGMHTEWHTLKVGHIHECDIHGGGLTKWDTYTRWNIHTQWKIGIHTE